jgi:hypothetical protein
MGDVFIGAFQRFTNLLEKGWKNHFSLKGLDFSAEKSDNTI